MASQLLDISQALRQELIETTRAVLISKGVESNSDLVKSVDYKDEGDGAFTLLVNDYYEFVSKGRKPRARKVPISALIDFIKQNRIRPNRGQSINQLAYAIQTSIFKSGIKPKKFVDDVDETAFDVYEERIMDILEVGVVDAMANAFNLN